MADAVFTLTANITPTLDQGELTKQANAMAKALNSQLAGQIKPLQVSSDAGKFTAELQNSSKAATLLQTAMAKVQNTASNVANTGRAGFLKFTEAIGQTAVKVTGYSGSVLDAIKANNKFEDALNSVKKAGGGLGNLPDTFQQLQAQLLAGLTPLQQAAQNGGDAFTQAFATLANEGVVTTEVLNGIGEKIGDIGKISSETGTTIKNAVDTGQFDLLASGADKALGKLLNFATNGNAVAASQDKLSKQVATTVGNILKEGGTAEELSSALVKLREQTDGATGGTGFLLQKLGLISSAQADAAKAFRFGIIQALSQIDPDKLTGIQKLQVAFSKLTNTIETNVATAKRALDGFGRTTLGTALFVQFDDLRTKVESTVSAIGTTLTGKLDTALAPLAGKLGTSLGGILGGLSDKVTAGSFNFAAFIEKNLTQPLAQGIGTLKAEGARLGNEVLNGIKSGLTSGGNAIRSVVAPLGKLIIDNFKSVLGIHSPSTVAAQQIGEPIDEGIAQGINQNAGLITKAVNAAVTVALGPVKQIGGAFVGATKAGFAAVGVAAGAASVALGAVGTKAIAAGVGFNELQATVKGTLPVLVGSHQAADQLLDSVNKLNDSSPFSRQSFLELTKVLAGFGVQASKIPGVLDAIQQTVAATGGSEADLNELGQAFARLQSQGHVSLDVLQSFTLRGVDAVGLLAAGLKKTTSETQNMISQGLIPATQAIDILSTGLKDKFGGATDTVFQGLAGAQSRVQARLRDLGAELSRAFVSPDKGGAYIDFLNSLAGVISKVKDVAIQLRPQLQAVADTLSTVSQQAAAFIKAIPSDKIADFVKSLGPLLPLLGGFAAFLPGLAGGLPVVGPLIAKLSEPIKLLQGAIGALLPEGGALAGLFESLGGPITALVASLLTTPQAIKAFGNLFKTLAPTIGALLPALAGLYKAFSNAFGPVVASFIDALGPVLAAAGDAITKLVTAVSPLVTAIGHLVQAVLPPLLKLVGGELVFAFNAAGKVIEFLSPVITVIANVISNLAIKLTPVIEKILAFRDAIISAAGPIVKDVIGKLGDAIKFVIGLVSKFADTFSGVIKKLTLGHVNLGKFDVDFSAITDLAKDPSITEAKNGINGVSGAMQNAAAVSKDMKNAIDDAFKASGQAAKAAADQVNALSDSLKQTLQQTDQKINPLVDAANNAKSAIAAVSSAQNSAKQAAADVGKLQKEYAQALRDTITPADELAKAERTLQKTREDIAKNDRDILATEQELSDLRNQDLQNDKRAALDRAVERAKIALNKAQRDAIDLTKEANKENQKQVNLSGLSLDQVRSQLANVRLNLQAQTQATAANQDAAAAADDELSKKLDVADAEQALKDATKARAQFEVDSQNQILDDEAKLHDLQGQKLDLQLTEKQNLNDINDLKAGDTAQSKVILDYTQRIKDAVDKQKAAQQAVTTAINASKQAALQLQLQEAILRDDVQAQANIQTQIWQSKLKGLQFDQQTETSLKNQLALVGNISSQLNDANNTVANLGKNFTDAQKQIISQAQDLKGLFDQSVGNQQLTQQLLAPDSLPNVLLDAANKALAVNPDDVFAQTVKNILLTLEAQRFPGFTHGGIIEGVSGAYGQTVRVGEWGRAEAILPLTRPYEMASLLSDNRVLHPVLNALGRIDLSNAIKVGKGSTAPLSGSMVRSGGTTISPSAARADAKEMAAYVGAAVKEAVTEALAESDKNFGADIDINVHPTTNNEVVVAREVKRQVKKATENKWW